MTKKLWALTFVVALIAVLGAGVGLRSAFATGEVVPFGRICVNDNSGQMLATPEGDCNRNWSLVTNVGAYTIGGSTQGREGDGQIGSNQNYRYSPAFSGISDFSCVSHVSQELHGKYQLSWLTVTIHDDAGASDAGWGFDVVKNCEDGTTNNANIGKETGVGCRILGGDSAVPTSTARRCSDTSNTAVFYPGDTIAIRTYPMCKNPKPTVVGGSTDSFRNNDDSCPSRRIMHWSAQLTPVLQDAIR
jgi:hypothetical protein